MPTCKKGIIMDTILNIAAGKLLPIDLIKISDPYFLINTDIMYYQNHDPKIIEEAWLNSQKLSKNRTYYCKSDIYEFMERTKILFNRVCIYRFLEHVHLDKVSYFIYLLSTITQKGSIIDIVVPNYTLLAEMILNEKIDNTFDANNILLTTELLNQPPDPHTSIWTEERMKYFWELEGRFKVISQSPSFKFDGRDIYLRSFIQRV